MHVDGSLRVNSRYLTCNLYNFCSRIVVTAPCYECNDVPLPDMKRLFGLLSVKFIVNSTDLKSRWVARMYIWVFSCFVSIWDLQMSHLDAHICNVLYIHADVRHKTWNWNQIGWIVQQLCYNTGKCSIYALALWQQPWQCLRTSSHISNIFRGSEWAEC